MIGNDLDLRNKLFLIVPQKTFSCILSGEKVAINEENLHHIRRVLRQKGDIELNISSGDGKIFPAKLNSSDKIEKLSDQPFVFSRTKKISLMTSGIQKKNLEYLIQKSTELGIDSFYFIRSDYDNFPVQNPERYRKMAISACIQSKNPVIPEFEIFSLKLADILYNKDTLYLWGDPGQSSFINTVNLADISAFSEICFINGPEGGWSPKEVDFLKNRFRSICLSNNVLRAETAAIAAIFYLKLLTKGSG
ncbi:MAG: 16S rRNA (uracil(1498)-N(3))-methyltransferase [Spirochaetia bacterium]|nr:16S rRNA (uracil(1498)-N(3))-methyltransferase [Spirochaetia bacterium]